MANMSADIRSLADALDFLDGKLVRKLGHNTWVHRYIGGAFIRLHRTHVVTYHRDGDVTLTTGGHQTVTTKDRLNRCSPLRVWQHDWDWFVAPAAGGTWQDVQDRAVPFYDGIRFTSDGNGSLVSVI